MPPIGSHSTGTDVSSSWDASKVQAATSAALSDCHAWYKGSDPDQEGSYELLHHFREGGPAIISGVNNCLARLPNTDMPANDRSGCESHLRKHRQDAKLEAEMSEMELIRAVNNVSREEGYEGEEFMELLEAVRVQEGMKPKEKEAQTQDKQMESAPVAFKEALSANKDGTINVCIATPGWGNSGYFSEDLLRESVGVFKEGLHMYWDHPTLSEEFQRPERSLRDLAGVLAETAEWQESGFNGPGVYSTSRVFSPYMEALEDLASHIGLSMVYYGTTHHGKVEDTSGDIVDRILAARSVDFVTLPARGGKVESKFESLREETRIKQLTESGKGGDLVDTATAEKLKSDNEALKKENQDLKSESERHKEVALESAAEKFVKDTLSDVKGIPEQTKVRLTESLSASPVVKDGKLDEDKMKERIEDTVKKEAEYLKELGFGKVRDLGGGSTKQEESDDDYKKGLQESFKSLGLGDDAAKVAAEGR